MQPIRCSKTVGSKNTKWILLMGMFLFISLSCENEVEEELEVCGDGPDANSSAILDEIKLQISGTAAHTQGSGILDGKSIWTEDVDLVLQTHKAGCWHAFPLTLHNAKVGEAKRGNNSVDGSFTWSGNYNGDQGFQRIASGSTVVVTALTENSISGTFVMVLEDGTTFAEGKFKNVSIGKAP